MTTDLYTEIIKSESIMNLTESQFDQLKDSYAYMIVDDMDMKTLVQFAYDVICENLSEYDDLELADDVANHFGEDVVDFVENVLTQEEVDYYFKGW